MLLHLLLIADSLLSFSFDLEKELQPKNQNSVYSPVSIATTLGMISAGAKEQTLKEIHTALHFNGTQEQLSNSFREMISKMMTKENGYPNMNVHMETVLWMQNNFQFLPQFQSEVVKDFFGDLRSVDFLKPEEAVKEMNSWFFQKTGGDLGALFTTNDITAATKLVVVSTLYLKGYFEKAFDTSHTRMKTFHVNPLKEISIQMMYQKNQFPYYKGNGFQVVELNYLPLEKEFALWIILPDKELQPISQEAFNTITANLKPQELELEMPRFKLESSLNLIPTLEHLGIKEAFTTQANFSLMTEANNLMISDFKHRALIIVEESGTLAEAATSATFVMKSLPPQNNPIVFNVDHPFLFFLIDKKNGVPIFIGQVVEPKGSITSQF